MILIDITETDFIQLIDVEEANSWMNDNIGHTIQDDWDQSSGVGWKIRFEQSTLKWILELDSEDKAILFLLRWK